MCGVLPTICKFAQNAKVYLFIFLLFASQDGSCNGNAHLDLFHYLLFSYSYYLARFIV